MVLSNIDINKELKKNGLVINPFSDDCLDGCGYDLHLGSKIRIPKKAYALIDLTEDFNEEDYYHDVLLDDKGFEFSPGMHILATVEERIELPLYLMGELHGKSTLARQFIQVHSTAGIVKPGWKGHLVLELSKAGKNTILLKKGMEVGYITFKYLRTPTNKGYSGKYQEQNNVLIKSLGKQKAKYSKYF